GNLYTGQSSVTVNVANVNEAPTNNTPSLSMSERLGGPAHPTGFYLQATDPDGGPISYYMMSGYGGDQDPENPGFFTIQPDGQLYLNKTFPPGVASVYKVHYWVVDGAGFWQPAETVINIIPEHPPVMSFTPRATGPASNYVGHASATDLDGGAITYRVIGGYQDRAVLLVRDGQQSYTPYWEDVSSVVTITSAGDLYANITFGTYDYSTWEYTYQEIYGAAYLTFEAVDDTGRSSNPITVTFDTYA